MKEAFEIEFAKRRRVNKVGAEIASFGFFFLLIFGFCLLPARYLPAEVGLIYLVEVVNRNVYIILSAALTISVLGLWLKGLKNYEKAELEIKSDGILLISNSKKINLKFENIKKFKNSAHFNFDIFLNKTNFIIVTNDNRKFEIRTESELFETLQDFFPEKY